MSSTTTLSRLLASDENLTRKAYLNSLASGLDFAARLLVGFCITPLLVSGLGDLMYGAWMVLGRLTGYLTAAGARPNQALKCVLANRQSSADFEEKRQCVGSALIVWLVFLPLQGTLGAVVAWFAPRWLDVSPDVAWVVRVAAIVLVMKLMASSLVTLPQSILEGENLGYRRMGLTTLLVLFGGGLSAAAVYLNTGLIGVAVSALASVVLSGALLFWVVLTHVPWFGVARPTRQSMFRFVGLSGWFLAWRFIMKLLMTSDVVLLGVLTSAEAVTAYALAKYLPEALVSMVAIVVFGMTPGLGRIIGAGDHRKARVVRGEAMLLTWLIVTTAGSTILMWNDSFLRLWVGTQYSAGSVQTLLLLVMAIQLILIRNDANVIDLTLDLRQKVLLGAISSAVSLGGAAVLVGKLHWGVQGLCIGFIAGRLILSIGYPLLVGRVLDCPWTTQLQASLRPLVTTFWCFFLATELKRVVSADTWIALVLAVATTLVVGGGATLMLGASHAQRSRVLRRLKIIAGLDGAGSTNA
jgi:O-antigen/teichoic acid export membrane protein